MAHVDSAELLSEIDRYLSLTGMGEKYLGLASVRNGHVVPRLRRGGYARPNTATRMRAFMGGRLSNRDWLKRVQELRQINRVG